MNNDDTPTDRPMRLPLNAANEPLVRALHNHAMILESTARRVTAVELRIVEQREAAGAPELSELARAFRQEADSAHDLARTAEKLAAGGGG